MILMGKILITITMMMMLVRLLGTAEHRSGNRPSARLLGKADYCPDSRPWWSTIFFWGLMWCYNCLTKPTLLHKGRLGSQKWMNFWNNSGRTSTPPDTPPLFWEIMVRNVLVWKWPHPLSNIGRSLITWAAKIAVRRTPAVARERISTLVDDDLYVVSVCFCQSL